MGHYVNFLSCLVSSPYLWLRCLLSDPLYQRGPRNYSSFQGFYKISTPGPFSGQNVVTQVGTRGGGGASLSFLDKFSHFTLKTPQSFEFLNIFPVSPPTNFFRNSGHCNNPLFTEVKRRLKKRKWILFKSIANFIIETYNLWSIFKFEIWHQIFDPLEL